MGRRDSRRNRNDNTTRRKNRRDNSKSRKRNNTSRDDNSQKSKTEPQTQSKEDKKKQKAKQQRTSGSTEKTTKQVNSDPDKLDIKKQDMLKLMRALGNTVVLSEGPMRKYNDYNTDQEREAHVVTKEMYGELTDIVADYNIQSICDTYGIDWQSDVIEYAVGEQSLEQMAGFSE